MKVLGVEVPPAEAEKERVLDVPAIVMSESASSPVDVGSADVAKRPRRRRTARPPKARRAKATKTATQKGTRDGSVGPETFAAVEALVKDGSSKTEAFKAVAKDTQRSAGTVAATDYRVARSEGAVKPRRGRGKAAAPATTKRRSAGRRVRASIGNSEQDIDRLATSLVESVNALAGVVKAQSQEVADLRRRLDGVRSILD
jgi:hypothetical protein